MPTRGCRAPPRARALWSCAALVAGLLANALPAAGSEASALQRLASVDPRAAIAAVPLSNAGDDISWPTDGWPVSTPEAQGIDSATLANALVQIHAHRIPIHSLLIVRHGRIVLDSYFRPFADGRTHNVYSVTKSVTSMLVGIAQATHELPGVDTPVYALLSAGTGDDPRKPQITLAHLLSMTSGLDCRPDGGESLLQQMLRSRHLAAFMLDRPIEADPGTVFDYCGGNSEVVSAVLTKTTGTSAFEFARRELFAPLGITRVSWSTDGDRVSHGWGDLMLQPRDMAKLGYLWLHNGRWGNRQVVPAEYLAEALTSHASVQPGIEYGYGMWLYPGHTPVDFEANGSFGQRITVIPSLDMVEVTTGGGFDANEVARMIAAAPKSDGALAANPEANTRLVTLVAEAAGTPSLASLSMRLRHRAGHALIVAANR